MRALILPILALFIFLRKEDPQVAAEPEPLINCGTSWATDCLDTYWTINKSNQATLTVLPNGYNGRNSLLLYNPHGPNELNPQPLRLNSFIKNVKKDAPYKVSFYARIKGYPDYANAPSLAAYVFDDNDWYNEMYYGSPKGQYHDKDWSQYSFTIIGKDKPTLNFELYSLYDSTWISDLKIEECKTSTHLPLTYLTKKVCLFSEADFF
jgi:hypothetical protein